MKQDSNAIRQEIIDFKKIINKEIETNGYGEEYFPLINELQKKIVRLLESYNINRIAVPVKGRRGMFSFIRCRDLRNMNDGEQITYWLERCESSFEEPESDRFEEFYCDFQPVGDILLTIDQLTEHGIPTSEWHKAQDLSVYCNLNDLITREQIDRIEEGLIKAKNSRDMKEYTRLSIILQKGIVAILESNGINQIALKYRKSPEYKFFRIVDPNNLDDWGDCFLESCVSVDELPNAEDFMDTIVAPDTARAILNRIDRYKNLGIPTSEWHKAIDLSKYAE